MALNRRSPRRELRRVRVHASGQREKDGGVGAGAACARTQREGRGRRERAKEENRTRMAPAQAPRPERQGRLAPHGAPARRWRSSVVEAGQGSAESVENARRGKRRRGVFVTRDEKRPVTTLSAKGCAGARSTGCRKPQGFTTSLATTGPSRALPSLGRMDGIVTVRCATRKKFACSHVQLAVLGIVS